MTNKLARWKTTFLLNQIHKHMASSEYMAKLLAYLMAMDPGCRYRIEESTTVEKLEAQIGLFMQDSRIRESCVVYGLSFLKENILGFSAFSEVNVLKIERGSSYCFLFESEQEPIGVLYIGEVPT